MKSYSDFLVEQQSLNEAKTLTVALKGVDNIEFKESSRGVDITIADGSNKTTYTIEKGIDLRKVKQFFEEVK